LPPTPAQPNPTSAVLLIPWPSLPPSTMKLAVSIALLAVVAAVAEGKLALHVAWKSRMPQIFPGRLGQTQQLRRHLIPHRGFGLKHHCFLFQQCRYC